MNTIRAFTGIAAGAEGRKEFRGGKGSIVGEGGGEGESDRGAFPGQLESMKLRGQVATTTDLAKVGSKGMSNRERIGNKRVRTVEDRRREGGVLAGKLMDLTPYSRNWGGGSDRRHIPAPAAPNRGADGPAKVGGGTTKTNEGRELARSVTAVAVAVPSSTLLTQRSGAVRVPPGNTLGSEWAGGARDSSESSRKDRHSKVQKHIRNRRKRWL